MATRAERAEEAELFCEDWVDLLWTLAINRGPVKRRYLEAVSGLEGRRLVKALAKMANASILALSEGLEFEIDKKAFAGELRSRVPEETALRLHLASLDWGEAQGASADFMLTHRLGAGAWSEAADDIISDFEARISQERRAGLGEVARAKTVLMGLMDQPDLHRDAIFRLGFLLLEHHRAHMKPMEIKNLVASLGELDRDNDWVARLELIETHAKAESKARRKAKKAERTATEEPELAETAPSGETPSA